MMSLGLPIGLWALAALAPLVAIYVFQRNSRPRPVSSLLLWDGFVRRTSGRSRVQRPPFPISLLLEILAIVVMAMGLADLRARLGAVRELPIVILDNSLSMGAIDTGASPPSALDRARERVREIVRREGVVRLVLAEETPRLLGDATPETLDRVCAPWRADAPLADIPAALAAALQLASHAPRIAVLTDGMPADAGVEVEAHPELRWIGVGRAVANIAITDAAGTTEALAFDLRAFADAPVDAAATLLSGPDADALRVASTRGVTLAPDRIATIRSPRPDDGPIVAIRLADDALGADNTVVLAPDDRPPVRARLDIAHDGLRAAVHGALHATGQAVIDAANPELVLTDSAQPEITGARTVRFEGSSGAPDAKPSRSFTGPFVLERTHRLVEGVDLTGAIWAIPEPATPLDPASIPLVLADTMPVVYEDPSSDLRIRIDIEASTVTATPGWPALVWNIVRWRADQRPGLARANIPLGEPARCIGLESDEPAILVRPDGSRQPVPVADGVATVMSTQLGLHRIEHGEHRWVFSVQPLRLSESDLRSRRTCDLGRWPRATETTGFRSLSWVWAIGAIGVLALHSRMLREWSDAA